MANKVDLDERRVISPKAGRQLADQHGLEYFEVSAVSVPTFINVLFHEGRLGVSK